MIREDIEKLKVDDMYSLILFTLYKMQDEPEYSTLSELVYLLNEESLINLLDYFGGLTIKIPTMKEFRLILNALVLYKAVKLEGQDINKAIKDLNLKEEYQLRDIKKTYITVCDILSKYNFRRDK